MALILTSGSATTNLATLFLRIRSKAGKRPSGEVEEGALLGVPFGTGVPVVLEDWVLFVRLANRTYEKESEKE